MKKYYFAVLAIVLAIVLSPPSVFGGRCDEFITEAVVYKIKANLLIEDGKYELADEAIGAALRALNSAEECAYSDDKELKQVIAEERKQLKYMQEFNSFFGRIRSLIKKFFGGSPVSAGPFLFI